MEQGDSEDLRKKTLIERIGKEMQKDLKRKLIYFYIYRGKNALEEGGESHKNMREFY